MRRGGLSDEKWRGQLQELIAGTAIDDPRLAEQMTARAKLHSDESFEFGLGCLLDGISARTGTA